MNGEVFKNIEDKIKLQLSYDLNCDPTDFSREENVITRAVMHEKRRVFTDKDIFFRMATFGKNTVISADEELHPWLEEWVQDKSGIWLFEQHNFYELERKLRVYGHKMALTHHMFMPEPRFLNITTDLKIRWLEQKDIAEYYGRKEFPNALCDRFYPKRPDVLAVAALDGDKMMGMAGCSADAPDMWQIGIDVLPEYRGRGIAKTLVSLLRDETFRRGAIPYYGTSLSNLGSWKTALACGFVPAWIEVESKEDEERPADIAERFSRTRLLYGDDVMKYFSACRVAVFGVGGVGGYVVEALARSGIGAIDLIDNDRVCESNINRQIIATGRTIGEYKVDAAKERIRDINPECRVGAYKLFYLPETQDEIDFGRYDYVVDAIDTVTGKLTIIENAKKAGVPVISAMGAGNKLDPAAFEAADIYDTTICPLAKVMRRECRKRGIDSLKVVYSREEPSWPLEDAEPDDPNRRSTPGSTAFVPSSAGLVIAGEIINDLAAKAAKKE